MTRSAYFGRGLLYAVIAILLAVQSGYEEHQAREVVILTAVLQALVAVRAFVDQSATVAEKTQEKAAARKEAIAVSAVPPPED